jgi:hypothetical protein
MRDKIGRKTIGRKAMVEAYRACASGSERVDLLQFPSYDAYRRYCRAHGLALLPNPEDERPDHADD